MTQSANYKRLSGADLAYDTLRGRIISGEMPPNSRISEPGIAELLEISRTPAREAIRQLLTERLIERSRTGGIRVSPITVEGIRQVYAIRARLEGLLAHDACSRLTPEDEEALSRLVMLMERFYDDETELLRLGLEFHTRVGQVADNRWCAHLLYQLRGHIDRYRTLSTRQVGRSYQAAAEHRAILTVLQGDDPNLAEETMQTHIEHGANSAIDSSGIVALNSNSVPD